MTRATTTATACPTCGTKGKAVKPLTLRALLKEEFVGQVADAVYGFCDAQHCDTVYFGHGQAFSKPQLNVAVGVKDRSGDRPLCYCFGHSIATVKEELRAKGRSAAPEAIRREMKGPGCACEVKNPSGSCCLGAVAKGVETAKAELNLPELPRRRAETLSQVGTILTGIAASSCCWLPLVLLAFGVSGAGVAGALEAYRPLLVVLTLGFLAGAFYFAYRPRNTPAAADDCCAAQMCGAAPPVNTRSARMTLNKVLLWVVAALAVAFLTFPNYIGFILGGSGGEVRPGCPLARTTSFHVEGMTCAGCSVVVEKAVERVPGVLSVKVSYADKLAIVSTEACCAPPIDAILRALEEAGYRAEVIENGPPDPGQ